MNALSAYSQYVQSPKGRYTRDQKLQYNRIRASVANRRKPRLSWKGGGKGVQEEMALESLLQGRAGWQRACQRERRTGVKARGHRGLGTFGDIPVVPAGLEGRVCLRRGQRVGRNQKV